MLKLFGITVTKPTKQDHDVTLQLLRRLLHVYHDMINYTIFNFKDEMFGRCKGENKLAALLVNIPNESFLKVCKLLLTAINEGVIQ